MNLNRFFLLLFMFGALAGSACASPEFIGVLVSQGTTYIAVRLEEGGGMRWMRIGEAVGEYRAAAYDAKNESLLLKKGSSEIRLSLKTASVQPAPTLALLESRVKSGDLGFDQEVQQLRGLVERRNTTAAELADLEARARKDPDAASGVENLRRKFEIEEGNAEYFLRTLIDIARSRAKASK